MNYKVSYKLTYVGIGLGIMAYFVTNTTQDSKIALAGMVAVILGFVQKNIFYKCPYCKRKFNLRNKTPEVCPYCGERLEVKVEDKEL